MSYDLSGDGVRRIRIAATVIAFSVGAACSGSNSDERPSAGAPRAATTTSSPTPDSEPASTTTSVARVVTSPADVPTPRGAREAATRITAIERGLRSPATPLDQVPALGWEQQVIYRALARDATMLSDLLARVPDDIAVIVSANAGGSSSIATLVEPPVDLPTAWRIVTPPPPEELLGYYREAEAASGVPWPYLAAINLVETRMGRIVGDSTAGAQGPMQFIPSTWEAYGEGGDVRNHRDAILAAGRYLAAAGAPGDMRVAMFAYN
ncbi:MAG: lytic transglycosylase domain-containing protein, partial [Acidimicrobiia bacterium]